MKSTFTDVNELLNKLKVVDVTPSFSAVNEPTSNDIVKTAPIKVDIKEVKYEYKFQND